MDHFVFYQYGNVNGEQDPLGGNFEEDGKNSQLGYSIQISEDANTVIVGASDKHVMVY